MRRDIKSEKKAGGVRLGINSEEEGGGVWWGIQSVEEVVGVRRGSSMRRRALMCVEHLV